MSSVIIECPYCYVKNKIPADKIGQSAKCGACERIIDNAGANYTCGLCNKAIVDGMHLSNGEMIHQSCLDSIQTSIADKENKLMGLEVRLDRIHSEVSRRKSLGFKILSIFSKPEVDIDDLEQAIPNIKNSITRLLRIINNLQARVSPIYDFFLTYPPDWDERKSEVIKRDGEKCRDCSVWTHLHLHHIKPLSKGGSNKITNLKLLCESCHSKEHGGRDFSGEFKNTVSAKISAYLTLLSHRHFLNIPG